MQMFVKKMVFLLVYVALLFLVARILEYIAWYETGLLMMKLVDPVSLSVKKLKSLLDGRGLSYEGVVDKAELTQLVEASGHVMEGEVLMMEQDAAATEEEEEETTTTKFSSKTQFYEEVEDKKDSIWLVQVIPRNHGPLLGKKTWSTVVKKLSRFGIRHGTFDCSIDPRICAQKNWNLPLLLLAMPQGQRHKGQVIMTTFMSAGKAQQIINWVYSQLADRVDQRGIGQYFTWEKLESKHDVAIEIVLFSRLHKPPVFFSALNLKYSGRVKFVFVSKPRASYITDKQLRNYRLPSYVIVTPEGKKIYGENYGEYCTYSALDIYLQTLSPEANDIFNLSIIYVNAVCFIGLFVIQGGIAKRICRFLWTIGIYNITCILVWLPLLGIIQLPFLASVQDYLYKMVRLFSQTWLMGKVRQDWIMFSGHSYIMIGSFLLYCVVINWVSKKIHTPTNEDSMTSGMWLRASLAGFRSFLLHPSPAFRNGPPHRDHREEGLDLLIEQMATPDLWLHPLIPENYIKDLLTWRYSCEWLPSHSSGNENDSSDSEKGFTVCRHHKKKCIELQQYVLNCSLDCNSKSDLCPHSAKKKREDSSSNRQMDKGNFFVVKSQDKPHCMQPESLTRSDSDTENVFYAGSTAKIEKENSVDRSEAQLDHASSVLEENVLQGAKSDIYHEKCSCQGKPDDAVSEKESDLGTIDAYAKSKKDRDRENIDCVVASRKHSPKHHVKDAKSKTSPKNKPRSPHSDSWPEGILYDAQCAICIEAYVHAVVLCGLPCGHAYHQHCIVAWLNNGNHHCPICRWPAYKKKGYKLSKHME